MDRQLLKDIIVRKILFYLNIEWSTSRLCMKYRMKNGGYCNHRRLYIYIYICVHFVCERNRKYYVFEYLGPWSKITKFQNQNCSRPKLYSNAQSRYIVPSSSVQTHVY